VSRRIGVCDAAYRSEEEGSVKREDWRVVERPKEWCRDMADITMIWCEAT